LLEAANRNIDLLAGLRHRHRHRHDALGFLGSVNGVLDAGAVAADHMHRSIDHGLRRINLAIAAHLGVGFLAGAEARIRQRILPAQIIPVIDRHAQRDYGRVLGQFTDNLVGGRTGGTSLRREQLHHRARVGVGRAG